MGVNDKEAEIKFACRGYPAHDGRVSIGELVEEHKHNMSFHQTEIFCQNCQEVLIIINGLCSSCLEQICPICGCTDFEPCIDGCYWMPSGNCSACEEQLEAEYI